MQYDIGILDSGSGGLNILYEIIKLKPNIRYVYLCDNLNSPYGDLPREKIKEIVEKDIDILFSYGVKEIVLACNTATAVCAASIRKKINIPIIGIEPAILPAFRENHSENILVLATKATIENNLLLNTFSSKNIIKRYVPKLAALIDNNLNDLTCLTEFLRGKLNDLTDIKSVVLGCTHFEYIKPCLSEIFPKAKFFYCKEAVAKRAVQLFNYSDTAFDLKILFTGKYDENIVKFWENHQFN